MVTEIRLAQFGMGMQEGRIVRWLKAEGERVRAGEPILEVESEKALVEIEAPAAGVLIRAIATAEMVIPVGGVLGEMISDADAGNGGPASGRPEPPSGSSRPSSVLVQPVTASAAPSVTQCEPRARRLAKDAGIDLARVTGTGPNGRITEDDIRRAIAAGDHRDVEVVPLQGVRGVIARRMTESLQTMAQLTLHTEADVTALNEQRARQAGDAAPSVTDLIIRATVTALHSHPAVNATIEDGSIRRHRAINLGVATHTDRGLVVPVLKNAAALSVAGIRDRLRELVGEVRAGTAKSAQLEGGTFTVTNLGPFGIDAFTPIIQPPQIAILGVGRIRGRYIRGSAGPEWHEFISLSLTFDHRALDGVPAANFLTAIVGALQTADAPFRPE